VFPGTNCEHDVVKAMSSLAGTEAPAATVELVWHGERSLSHLDGVVLPGGFAHGDYLRPGAIARFSNVTDALARFAAEGGPVVGICNGFQVLTEAGLLPGALQKNSGLRFVCKSVGLRVCSTRTVLTEPFRRDSAFVCRSTTSKAITPATGAPSTAFAPRTVSSFATRRTRTDRWTT